MTQTHPMDCTRTARRRNSTARRCQLGVAALLLAAPVAAFAESPAPVARPALVAEAEVPLYTWRRQHDPNGIGKFYMNREIAHVMSLSPGGVQWLERTDREQEEQTSLMVKSLGIKPGMTVADIGAGSGRITVMLAEEVGPRGKVLAVDIQDEMLVLLDKKLRARKITNVEGVLGTDKSPKLKPASVDLALMVDVYHEFEFPYEMMLELSAAMKPGGRIAFVEFRKEDPDVAIKEIHKMTQAQVKFEVNRPEFQLKWKETIGVLPIQHIVVFEKLAASAPRGK